MSSYVKMQADQFSLFAKLHKVEEMGPTLAIIPACKEAERIVHMMNKQVTAFLYYYLTTITALPKKFVMDHASVGNRRLPMGPGDTVHHHPPQEENEDNLEELEMASWWNNAFHLKEIGKKNNKRTADKNPEKLFDLDADALNFATVHNRHLQPTFNLDEDDEDDKSEGSAPAANPSPATPPRKNPNQEATRTDEPLATTASPLSEEVVEGDLHAAAGG